MPSQTFENPTIESNNIDKKRQRETVEDKLPKEKKEDENILLIKEAMKLQWSQMLNNHNKINEINKSKSWEEARDIMNNERKVLYDRKLPIAKWAAECLKIPRAIKVLTTERFKELPHTQNNEMFANRLRFNYQDVRATMNDERPFIKNALMRCEKVFIIPSTDGKAPVIVFKGFLPENITPPSLIKRLQWLGIDGKLQTCSFRKNLSLEDFEKDGMICQSFKEEEMESACRTIPHEKMIRKHIVETRCSFYDAPRHTLNMPQKALTHDIMCGYMCTIFIKKDENENGKTLKEIVSKIKEKENVKGIHLNSIYSIRVLLDNFVVNYFNTTEKAIEFFGINKVANVRFDLPIRFVPMSVRKNKEPEEEKSKINNKGIIITSLNGIPAPKQVFEYVAEKFKLQLRKTMVTTAFALANSTQEAIKLHMSPTVAKYEEREYNLIIHAKATDDEDIMAPEEDLV